MTNHPDYGENGFFDEIHFIDLFYPLYKNLKYLIGFCFLAVLITAVISLRQQRIYNATAVLLLETKEPGAGVSLKSAISDQFGGFLNFEGMSGAKADVYLTVLKSKELALDVFRNQNFFYVMGIPGEQQDAYVKRFAGSVSAVKPKGQPIISITVEHSDPVMAADLANSYAMGLDRFNRRNTISSAQRLRKYIEGRLVTANKEMDQAQDALRNFQEQNRAVSISKQAEATLDVLSELESQRVALEVEKAAKEKFFGRPHVEIEQLKAKMEAIRKNIHHLTYGNGSMVPVENEKGKVEFYIPLTIIPGLNFNESKLLLNIKVKTNIISMLTTQLEQSKLEEAKDLSTINLLEPAKVPKNPIKPSRRKNVMMAGIISLNIGIFLIYAGVLVRKITRDHEGSPKWTEMKGGVTSLLSAGREEWKKIDNKIRSLKIKLKKGEKQG